MPPTIFGLRLIDAKPGSAARFPKHTWVVGERLQFEPCDFLVIGMRGINQAIVLSGGENGRYEQKAMLSSLPEFISEAGQFRWGSGVTPIRRQIARPKLRTAQVIRNFYDG